jgi:hypothetical protein
VTGKTVVPEEAVEAAANAISECSGMRFDGFWSRVEDLEPEDREYALTEARAALEAAAPFIAAKAWDEGYSAGKRVMVEVMSPTHFATEKPNPHRAAAVRGEG